MTTPRKKSSRKGKATAKPGGGKSATKLRRAVVDGVIVDGGRWKSYQGDARRALLFRLNEGRRVRVTYEVLS